MYESRKHFLSCFENEILFPFLSLANFEFHILPTNSSSNRLLAKISSMKLSAELRLSAINCGMTFLWDNALQVN